MKVLGGRVLVRHALKPAQTDGGIFLPDKFRGEVQEGVVVHVSDGWYEDEVGFVEIKDLSPGDRVLMPKHGTGGGTVVQVGDARLRVLHYKDILAVLETGQYKRCTKCKGQGMVEVVT